MATLAEITDSGCVAPLANGTVGQVLTIDASGNPVWSAAAADDQIASEVPITAIANIPTATTVQEALEAIALPPLAAACEAPITLHGLDIAGEMRRFNALFPMSVPNAGAVIPITELTNTGGNVSIQNGLAFNESNDIIPIVQGATPCGVDVQWKIRRIGAKYHDYAANIPYTTPNVSVVLDYNVKEWDDANAVTTGGGWVWTCPVAGRYRFTASVGVVYESTQTVGQNIVGTNAAPIMRLITFKNGAFNLPLTSLPIPPNTGGTNQSFNFEANGEYEFAVGDTLQFRYLSMDTNPHSYYPVEFFIERVF